MKRFVRICLFLSILISLPPIRAKAQDMIDDTDYYNDFNYDEIQTVVDDIIPNEDFNFEDYVGNLASGEEEISLQHIVTDIKNTVIKQFRDNIESILRLLSVVIIAALFTNFSNVFHNNQVSDTGFYITYLLLFTLLMSSFFGVARLAGDTLSKLLDFMKALVPTYFLSITFSAGSKSSIIFYEATLVLITLVDFILIKLIIPTVNIYLVLTLVNNITKEDYLSKLTELMALLIKWTLKTLLGTVIGYNAIQGMIVPAIDSVKKSFILKASGAIPGIGNALETVTKTIYGAGILVKNAIGVAGLVFIIVIAMVPMIELAIYTIIYKLGVAVVQPITDKRIQNCMNGVTEAAGLLLYTVFIGSALFFITIAIITTSTNVGLGG